MSGKQKPNKSLNQQLRLEYSSCKIKSFTQVFKVWHVPHSPEGESSEIHHHDCDSSPRFWAGHTALMGWDWLWEQLPWICLFLCLNERKSLKTEYTCCKLTMKQIEMTEEKQQVCMLNLLSGKIYFLLKCQVFTCYFLFFTTMAGRSKDDNPVIKSIFI